MASGSKPDGDKSAKRYNDILSIIDKRLVPDEGAKKARGEVFTPLKLVREMILGLRKSAVEKGHNEIWGFDEEEDTFRDEDETDRLGGIPLSVLRDPTKKWLDPANGIGNFPVVVFYILDYHLGKDGPHEFRDDKNKTKRRTHIVEKMLYMIELNKGNVNTSRKIFQKLAPGVSANIICANTLELTDIKLKTEFGIDRFDVVMGNPPFQDFQKAVGKRGGGDELYMKFVKKSLELLIPNGYLVFVHPPSWRKPEFEDKRKKSKNAGMFTLMAHDNQIEYLEIHSSADGLKVFKAGTRYDFYTMKKTKAYIKTTVRDINGKVAEIDLRKFEFLPNSNIKNVQKLFASGSEETCDLGSCIMYSTSAYESRRDWVSAKESAEFKYPLIHSTNKDGARYMYSSTKDNGFFGVSKVIFGESGINNPIIDLTGKYGMTQGAMAIAVENKKEADRLVVFLKSNFFKNILNSCMWGGFRIDWRLFTYFKPQFWTVAVDLDEPLHTVSSKSETVKKASKGGFNKTRRLRRTA